ncbi:MAG TPA: carboxypeptidase-like regulatory domain-containing protein, partial [Armatimonadota bacterium]|nr:carboxypeptidase-like regulatory domain-containing protein [Armatimonadota bacterium]
AALMALAQGCDTGKGTAEPREAAKPQAGIELTNEVGEKVDAFPVGAAAFVTLTNLTPYQPYDITLYAPAASAIESAQAAAEANRAQEMKDTKGHGPSEGGPSGQPAGGAPASSRPPGPTTEAAGPRHVVAGPEDAAPPADAPVAAEGAAPGPVPPDVPAPALGEPTTKAGEAGGSPADKAAAAQAEAAQVPAMPPAPQGTVVGGGVFMSDAEGKIIPTLIARDLGLTSQLPAGKYTLSVKSVGGVDMGSKTFDVVESKDPYCYPSTPDGTLKNAFQADAETLYVRAENLPPQAEVDIYVVADAGKYENGQALKDVSGSITYAQADDRGHVLIDVWTGCPQPGAYDIFIDLNNNGKLDTEVDLANGVKTRDVLYGFRTVGALVQEKPVVPGEMDLVAELGCAEDVYEKGPAPRVGSDKALCVRAAPTLVGATPMAGEASIYIVRHQDTWKTGDKLENKGPGPTKVRTVGAWGMDRVRVWPAPVLPGAYDVVVDVDNNGAYDRGIDLLDNTGTQENGVSVGMVVTDAGNLVTLAGRVVDSSGNPVGGAVVSSKASASEPVQTAEDGTYTLHKVLPQKVTVEAAAAAFQRSEVPVEAKPSTEAIQVADIVLSPLSAAGNTYLPIAPGNEWEYGLTRTLDGDVAIGPLADLVGPIEFKGTMLRSVGASDDKRIPNITLFPIEEEETVFVSGESSEGSTERRFNRDFPVELARDGVVARLGTDAELHQWLPSNVASGSTWVGWVPVGPYRVIGSAKATTVPSLAVPAGEFENVLRVTLTPTQVTGDGIDSSQVTGEVSMCFAPGVGEIQREVKLKVQVSGASPKSGESLSGAIDIVESLDLKSYKLAQAAAPAAPPVPAPSPVPAPEGGHPAPNE